MTHHLPGREGRTSALRADGRWKGHPIHLLIKAVIGVFSSAALINVWEDGMSGNAMRQWCAIRENEQQVVGR